MGRIRRCTVCKLKKLDPVILEMYNSGKKQVEILNYINQTHQNFLKKEGKSKGLNKSQLSICLNKHIDLEEIQNNRNLKDEELEKLRKEIDEEIEKGIILKELLKGEMLLTKNIQKILNQQIQDREIDPGLVNLYKHTSKQVEEVYFKMIRIEKDKLTDVDVSVDLSFEELQKAAMDYLENNKTTSEEVKEIENYFIQNKYELEELEDDKNEK